MKQETKMKDRELDRREEKNDFLSHFTAVHKKRNLITNRSQAAQIYQNRLAGKVPLYFQLLLVDQ